MDQTIEHNFMALLHRDCTLAFVASSILYVSHVLNRAVPRQDLLGVPLCWELLASTKVPLHCRSLAAAEQLSKAGFGQLAWINGGFDAAQPTDLPVKNAEDLRFGGIGGLSEALGWTDVQKQTSKSEGFLGGGFTIIKLVGHLT